MYATDSEFAFKQSSQNSSKTRDPFPCQVSFKDKDYKFRSKSSNHCSLVGQSQHLPSAITVANRYTPSASLDLDYEVIDPLPDIDQVSQVRNSSRIKELQSTVSIKFRIRINPVDQHVLSVGKKKVKEVNSQLSSKVQSNNQFQLVCSQLSSEFWTFSLSPPKLYEGPPTDNTPAYDPLKLHKMIRHSGVLNYIGPRIPIALKLKFVTLVVC